MSDFRSFTVTDAVDAAAAALSNEWGAAVRVDAVRSLGDEERRNFIVRAQGRIDGTEPRSIIIKATRAASYDPDAADAYTGSGLVKEWAAASLLARPVSGQPIGPTLLAADLRRGVLVFDDLGDGLPSLVEKLLHGTADEAEHALIAYAEALAALHRATFGCRANHSAIVQGGFPAAVIPPPAHRWIENVARVPHSLLGGDFPDDEIAFIADRLGRPGDWQALVHGDPCPDNVLLSEGRALLIDFEFARPGHALLDAAYWRMGFPTCWCAGTVPADVRREVEAAYRTALADSVPQASDDVAFRVESAVVDAAWMLGNLAWLLEGALVSDRGWGRWTNRGRIVSYLATAICSTEEAATLPALRALAATWLVDLRSRWPEAAPLSDFPAFGAGLA